MKHRISTSGGGTLQGGLDFDLDLPEFTDGYPLYPRVFVCPLCCEVWGRIGPFNSDQAPHIPQMVSCEQHAWKSLVGRGQVPGSLIEYDLAVSGIDIALLDSLPEFLLRREFLLTLKALTPP